MLNDLGVNDFIGSERNDKVCGLVAEYDEYIILN